MLHVATLIHDDIVDVAPLRRGLTSVHAERGTEMAVLIGDLQFIQAIRCFADAIDTQEDMRLVRLVLEAGFKVCCGELDELATDPNWRLPVLLERYFRVVDRKTGMLFGVACECGASLVGARSRETFQISRFGRRFGRAFQIMDDVFDLMRPTTVAGKAPGVDLAQRRITLPVIYALDELPADHPVHRILRGEAFDDQDLHTAVEAVRLSSGVMRGVLDGTGNDDRRHGAPRFLADECLSRCALRALAFCDRPQCDPRRHILVSAFSFFDHIYCINLDRRPRALAAGATEPGRGGPRGAYRAVFGRRAAERQFVAWLQAQPFGHSRGGT